MTDDEEVIRHSKAAEAELIKDPDERAKREALNALRQIDVVADIAQEYLDSNRDRVFRMRPSAILTLHREALMGISSYAGNYRPSDIEIGASKHEPPGAHLVPELVEDVCEYVNDNWETKTGIHLSSFVMWRLNWIHPFPDGNGRTARAASYLVLNVHEGFLLPGAKTIPEQIMGNRKPYYDALEKADLAGIGCADIDENLEPLEQLLTDLLSAQLLSVVERAAGSSLE